jgi:hypothetical protein
MPKGRPGVSGGFALVLPLSDAVNVRSLQCWVKRRNPPKLTRSELRECDRLLRKLISIYRIARATPQPTATERRRILGKIKTAAGRFVKKPTVPWRDKLLNRLEAADVNTRSILNHEIISRGHSSNALIAMKRKLQELFSMSRYPDESLSCPVPQAWIDRAAAFITDDLPVVHVLANIEVNVLVPGSGKWPDPALANLVAGLEPIWHRVTGRTAVYVPDSKTQVRSGAASKCPFAEWLGALFEGMEWQRPPVSRVAAVLERRKSKN